MARRDLTPEEKADADRLLAIWKLRFEGEVSQEEIAARCGWKTQAAFSQYLLGRIPLNLAALLKISKALDIDPSDVSPRLTADLPPDKNLRDVGNVYQIRSARPDVIQVQAFDATPSMGRGSMRPDADTVIGSINVSREWASRNLSISGAGNLAVLTAYGDSMQPTFSDGDLLLVDRGVREVRLDAVYVLALNDELFVKRVQRRITDGAVVIKSDNPLYDPVVLTNGERRSLEVLGRVVWAWNGRKL